MMEQAERLDDALESDAGAADDQLAPLVQLAAEVRYSLHRDWLSPWEREVLYNRALQLADRGRRWAAARRVLLDRRVQTLAGGAAVTLAAGTAIAVRALRQHRHQHVPATA